MLLGDAPTTFDLANLHFLYVPGYCDEDGLVFIEEIPVRIDVERNKPAIGAILPVLDPATITAVTCHCHREYQQEHQQDRKKTNNHDYWRNTYKES